MKKALMFFAVVAIAATFTSCASKCYTCTHSSTSSVTYDVCDGNVTVSDTSGTAVTTSLGAVKEKDYIKALETGGYTCSKKK